MVIVQICVGSSCHIRGSQDIVEMMQAEVAENHLEGEVELIGGFCFGKCNRSGVTVAVNEEVYPGVTREDFKQFWNEKVMSAVERERNV